MPEQVECAHVRGRDDDPLPSLMCSTQGGNILGGDRHERCQLFWTEMRQAEQFTEIPRRHAENRSRHRFQLRSRSLGPQDLTEIGDDICSIDRSKPNPEITRAIGKRITPPVR
jgi:hypothetical protein